MDDPKTSSTIPTNFAILNTFNKFLQFCTYHFQIVHSSFFACSVIANLIGNSHEYRIVDDSFLQLSKALFQLLFQFRNFLIILVCNLLFPSLERFCFFYLFFVGFACYIVKSCVFFQNFLFLGFPFFDGCLIVGFAFYFLFQFLP